MKTDETVDSVYTLPTLYFSKLGKEIKISPKALATINAPGAKVEFFVETVSVTIGIGNDHVAELMMSKAAWIALNQGAVLNVTTKREFDLKYEL